MQRSAHERVACVHSGASLDELAAVVHGGAVAEQIMRAWRAWCGSARKVCGGEQQAGERQERYFLFPAKGFQVPTEYTI